jgi:excisionase family DNA binding protein
MEKLMTAQQVADVVGMHVKTLYRLLRDNQIALTFVRKHGRMIAFRPSDVVRDSQPRMGMGVVFTDLDDARKALIENWIESLGSPALADLSQSPLSENAKPAPPPDQRDALVIRLIDLLHKKGLLSSNDVASLLRDRIL